MYAPHLGRFLQTDPIGYFDSPNLYTYVLNDPVNLTDPLGLACGGPATGGAGGSEIIISACRLPRTGGGSGGAGGNPRVNVDDFIDGLSGSSPDPGSAPQPPPKPTQEPTPTCQAIHRAAEQGKSVLPGWLTGTDRWNNPATLRGELAVAQMNVADARAISTLFGGYSSSQAQGFAIGYLSTRLGFSILGGIGLGAAVQGYGALSGRYADYAQRQADAISARLRELQAQRDGTCPA